MLRWMGVVVSCEREKDEGVGSPASVSTRPTLRR